MMDILSFVFSDSKCCYYLQLSGKATTCFDICSSKKKSQLCTNGSEVYISNNLGQEFYIPWCV